VRVLDLFSGIGGFSLGLERAGMRTVAFCEIKPHARAVLAKHWPDVPCYDDVTTLTAARLAADGIVPDVICGGFPCQDISDAGKRIGIEGTRSGLWGEYARIIGDVRPRYVIVENVAALLGRGLERVLGDLAQIGYDAEWHCIPASALGAPHRRDRIWIVAYPKRLGVDQQFNSYMQRGRSNEAEQVGMGGGNVADATSLGQSGSGKYVERGDQAPGGEGEADHVIPIRISHQWRTEPNVGRVANGVPNRSHRLKCLGNAVIPQIPEIIGRAIMSVHNQGEHP